MSENDADTTSFKKAFSKVIQSNICPIGGVMHDPVLCQDGFVYNGSSVEVWNAQGEFVSPMTRKRMSKIMFHEADIYELQYNKTFKDIFNRDSVAQSNAWTHMGRQHEQSIFRILAICAWEQAYRKSTQANEKATGNRFLLEAADMGSGHAKFMIAESFFLGAHGFQKNKEEATEWFNKIKGSSIKDVPNEVLQKICSVAKKRKAAHSGSICKRA